jgi:hypothetical protein
MIKPQHTPEMFEDLRKTLSNEIMSGYQNITFFNGLLNSVAMRAPANKAEEAVKVITSDKKAMDTLKEVVESSTSQLRSGLSKNTPSLFFCDKEMSEMVEMGAKTFEFGDMMDISLVPSETGFCYFNKGITLRNNLIIHALAWTPQLGASGIGYWIAAYNDKLNEVDYGVTDLKDVLDAHGRGDEIPPLRLIYRQTSMYVPGESLSIPEEARQDLIEKDWIDVKETPITGADVLHSLLLMLKQPPTIITVERRKISNKKQLKRLSAKGVSSEVLVVDVRHKYQSTTASGESTTNREYSKRWLVSGHWRRQPKKNELGEWIREMIWVNPHIKGPADKPFVATKRVQALLK